MIPVYIWVVYSWVHVLVRIPLDEPVRDFAHFYTQGVIALEGDAASLYDMERMADVAQRVLPGHQRVLYPPVYGPQMSLLFRPLAMLPYVPARHLWLAITILVYGICTYAIWRVCPRLRDKPGTTALLLIAAPALHYVAGFLQVSVIGLVCVTTGYLALRANRPFVAGLAFGLLAYKPPLAFGVGFVLAAAALFSMWRSASALRTWRPAFLGAEARSAKAAAGPARGAGASDDLRVAAGAIVAAVAQLAIGTLYWGPSILPAYVSALSRLPDVTSAMEPNKYHMHSWRTFFDLLGLPGPIALGAYVIASAITLTGAVLCWLSRGPLALRFSALLIATVLVDPHLYAYDLVVLIPGFLLLWDWVLGEPQRRIADVVVAQAFRPAIAALKRCATFSFNSAFVWLLYICYLSPLFVTLADLGRIQLSPLFLGLLGVVILGVLRSERAGDALSSHV
jgi:arabinofuranan 3-O-arabinosyltransferase